MLNLLNQIKANEKLNQPKNAPTVFTPTQLEHAQINCKTMTQAEYIKATGLTRGATAALAKGYGIVFKQYARVSFLDIKAEELGVSVKEMVQPLVDKGWTLHRVYNHFRNTKSQACKSFRTTLIIRGVNLTNLHKYR